MEVETSVGDGHLVGLELNHPCLLPDAGGRKSGTPIPSEVGLFLADELAAYELESILNTVRPRFLARLCGERECFFWCAGEVYPQLWKSRTVGYDISHVEAVLPELVICSGDVWLQREMDAKVSKPLNRRKVLVPLPTGFLLSSKTES